MTPILFCRFSKQIVGLILKYITRNLVIISKSDIKKQINQKICKNRQFFISIFFKENTLFHSKFTPLLKIIIRMSVNQTPPLQHIQLLVLLHKTLKLYRSKWDNDKQ